MKKKTTSEQSWDEIGKTIGSKIEKECNDGNCHSWQIKQHKTGGAFYGVGILGALIYYLSSATSLWTAIIGIIKALLWPGVIVYGALKFLGM